MAKNPLMLMCRQCGTPLSEKAKVCPSCGAKNKKPLFRKGWFKLLKLLALIALIVTLLDGTAKPSQTIDRLGAEATKLVSGLSGGKKSQSRVTAVTVSSSTTSAAAKPTAAPEAPAAKPGGLVDGMRPEFREAMDSYEAFYVEYCNVMKAIDKNPSDLALLGKSMKLMQQAEEVNRKFDAWDSNKDLNKAEMKYYIDVHSRVMKMLADVASD